MTAMAIASSSSEHVRHHNVALHHRVEGPIPINKDPSTTLDEKESWECDPAFFDDTSQSSCDACPHCADRCWNLNCLACASKSRETVAPGFTFLARADDEKYYTICQIRRHDHAQSAWLLVGDTIYDATEYLSKHPGGEMSILNKAGGKADCTVDFDFHSKGARRMWRKYRVGKVCSCPAHSATF